MKTKRIDRFAVRLIKRIKNYSPKEWIEDLRDFPGPHNAELEWLKKELCKVPEILVLDELEKKK